MFYLLAQKRQNGLGNQGAALAPRMCSEHENVRDNRDTNENTETIDDVRVKLFRFCHGQASRPNFISICHDNTS